MDTNPQEKDDRVKIMQSLIDNGYYYFPELSDDGECSQTAVCIPHFSKTKAGKAELLDKINMYMDELREAPGYHLVGFYADHYAKYRAYSKRVGLQKLLEDARIGKVDFIITESISGLCYKLDDGLKLIHTLSKRKIGIYFEKEDVFSLDERANELFWLLGKVAEERAGD